MSDKTIDLRSDTITLPTEAMREAMACAPLGDDVYGEDPSVNRLQESAAEKVGMEAALYVPSGTMGNACALMTHTNWGDEVLFEEQAHMYYWEGWNLRLARRTVREHRYGRTRRHHRRPSTRDRRRRQPGTLPRSRSSASKTPTTTTPATLGSVAEVAAVGAACREHGLKLHVDGARIFNAAIASRDDGARIHAAR